MNKLTGERVLRYWIITTEYPPYFTGGIGTYCYHTARMLRDYGHSVTVFMCDSTLSQDSIKEKEGIRVVRFVPGKTKTNKFLGYNTSLSYEFANIIKSFIETEGKPDIIESQEYSGIAYYLQQFKLLGYKPFTDLPILITCHSPAFLCQEFNHFPIYQFPDYWIGQMEKSSMISADILISPSRYLVNQAKQRMGWKNIIEYYVENPICIEDAPQQEEFEKNYIVSFGKLSPLKGSFQLLEYFKELWDEGFTCPLHIIGSTHQIFHPERCSMGELISKKYKNYINSGMLKLHGELSPEQARAVLLKSHIVIIPSLLDNFPYTVLEAMSLGRIVLASAQGGQEEIISDGKNGFLFDHNKKGDFRNKFIQALQLDKEEIKLLGENAVRTIKAKCSYSSVYHRKIDLISSYVKNMPEKKRLFPFLHSFEPLPGITDEYAESELLSIIIPYFNMGKYIEECILSILASDYKRKEIIIVNDGSNETESIKVLSELESKYPVVVFHKKNEGLSVARNYGAINSNGQFLAFLDPDDTIEKSYYNKAISVLKRYDNVHFVGSWTKYFGASEDCWPGFNPEPPFFLLHNMINSSSLVFKRKSFLQHGINDKDFIYGMEDWDSVINMVNKNCGGVVLPELLFNYRVRRNSMARKFNRVKRLYLHHLITKKYSDLYKMYALEITNILQANGSSLTFDNPTRDIANQFYLPVMPRKWQNILKVKIKQKGFLRKLAYYIYKKTGI